MIMIEHFSKWVKLLALLNKSSHNTSHNFLQQVLNRFGACAKCLHDQGSEFRGKFQDLLDHAFIDHRRTSKDHPQADGLIKRMVQTCKKKLRNICLARNKEDQDMALPYIVVGQRMSKHASLFHFSPYFLCFRRHPIPFHPLPWLLKWTRLWTWTFQPFGLRSSQKGLLYLGGLCQWPWRTFPLHNIKTPYSMHTNEAIITNLR